MYSYKKTSKKMLVVLLLPLAVLLVYLSTFSTLYVERFYSTGFYNLISQAISIATGIFPFSLAELIITAIAITVVIMLIRVVLIMFGRSHRNIIPNIIVNILAVASTIYFLFIILWGLNYHRLPFSTIANLNIQPATVDELKEVCEAMVNRTNELRNKVNEDDDGIMNLKDGRGTVFNTAYMGYDNAAKLYPELGGKYGRPKGVILSHLMSYAGISGVYFPFTAEANVNIVIPDCMLPSTTCHEMAHQRGFAREDEANYIAYVACNMHPDTDFQYSGNLLALINCMNSLYSYDEDMHREVTMNCSKGVLRDLRAISEFWNRYEGPVEELSSSINDAYLKSNMQTDGIHSYGRMVDLLIAEYRETKFR
jgi:hypothetical protein